MHHPKNRILITCPKGIAPFLQQEITALGFPVLREETAGVETQGDLSDCLRLNLFIRTGHRVLFLLKDFQAFTADDLYREVSEIPWEDYIPTKEYLCVNSSVWNDSIRDTRLPNLKCKDAIVDRLRDKFGERPDSGHDEDNVVVFLYWKNEMASIYLDTSGQPLPRRNYRKISLRAPMQESLAAAVMLATGWDGQSHLVNPMCGSGTLAIEAALIALQRASGILRDNFSFMHLRNFDKNGWEQLRQQANKHAKKQIVGRIIATDISPQAVAAAQKNATTAGVEQFIEFGVCDFAQTTLPPGPGTVILNPEYGERLGETSSLETVYKGIGDFFKQKCQGYTGFVFTGNLALAKKIGLHASRRIPFYNSEIECRLLRYELYAGSRRREKENP